MAPKIKVFLLLRLGLSFHDSKMKVTSVWHSSLNSYCGIFSHWNNFNLRKRLLTKNPEFGKYGMFTMDYKKYHVISHAPLLFS